MSPVNQTVLARFAVATSVFALLVAAFVAATTDGSGSGTGSGGSSAAPVPVTLSEFEIAPGLITVPQGGALAVTNSGTQVHNVSVEGTSVASVDLPGGGTETLDLSSLSPGTYEVICTIPGHEDSGMTATLVVTDGEGSGGEVVAGGDEGGHESHDLADLDPDSELAQRINKEFEDAMSAGVETFVANQERFASGELELGNRRLEPEVLADGTKRFELTAAITDWQVEEGNVVKAWTYNGQVPGPWMRVEPGDQVQVDVTNEMPISTDVHWHGIDVPFDQDGVAPITQDFIRPGETFTYRFTAPDFPQLGMYHAHMHGQVAIVNGQFGVMQVGDVDLPRGRSIAGVDVPADLEVDQEYPMVLNDAGVIGLTLNGKSFPETEMITANQGDWVLIHFYNEGLAGHPMHLHRQPHLVVAKDGYPLTEPYRADTIWISPGERYSILVEAEEAGLWAFHCHIVSHAENDDGLFGMVTVMNVVAPEP